MIMKNINLLTKWMFLSSSLLLLMINCYAIQQDPTLSIVTDKNIGRSVSYGLTKLTEELQIKNISFEKVGSISKAEGNSILVVGLSSGEGEAAQILKEKNHEVPEESEALTIWKTNWHNKDIWVVGGFDDRGLMYGLLDVANHISWIKAGESPMSEVKEITEKPDVKERAISMFTMNRAYWEERFYNQDYWVHYLDMLAKDRLNNLTIIFGYENGGFLAPPYPYFFDVKGFPGVRMDITPQEQKRNLAALNRLIEMAHDRGINVTIGIWDHIYRGRVQSGGVAGENPNQVKGLNANNLIPYTKAALDKFIHLVPDLNSIQFRMHYESGLKPSEQPAFWSDVFQNIKKVAPDLRIDLRAKELLNTVIQSAINSGIKFRITTKYWMEQMGMPFHPTQINPEESFRRHSYEDLLHYPKQYDIFWRLWNGGTTRILLWGDPEYVRRFAKSTHLYDGDGFEVNEPLATKMEGQPTDIKVFQLLEPEYRYYKYEFERYWHFYQVFGRIGYNPNTSSEIWDKEFERHFGPEAAPYIEKALHEASWILPRIIASVYPYSHFPLTYGWAEKQRLGSLPRYARDAGSDIQLFENFNDAAKRIIVNGHTVKVKPSETSQWFKNTSSDINKLISEAKRATGNNQNKEFKSTIVDLKILSSLALYHSRRIPAAVSYRLFKLTGDLTNLDEAISYERGAIDAWQQIVDAAKNVYTDNLRMGACTRDLCGNWEDELKSLKEGLSELSEERQWYTFKNNSLENKKMDPATHYHYKAAPNVTYNELFQIKHTPITSIAVGKPLKIRIKVNASNGVKWVHLRYRSVKQHLPYQTMVMQPTEEKDVYQAVVPAKQIDPHWDFMYFIEVMDNNGNGRIYPDFNKRTPYIFVKLIR